MLYDFLTTNRDAIIARTREKVSSRSSPSALPGELENGVPLFLTQLASTLRAEAAQAPFPASAIGASAARHGGELLALGFNVSQVVHGYGNICQAVTELAVEERAQITTEEFHTLNRCLDVAIAEAVTEHARITADSRSSQEVERLGQLGHEIRNMVNTALLAFDILKRGTVGVGGTTGAVLGRSLIGLRDLVDNTLADIRMTANQHRQERVTLTSFINDMALAGSMHADYSGLRFTIEPVDPALMVDVDPQLLSSALMNLLNNAFKYTRAGGHVTLQVRSAEQRVLITVEDECGGLPANGGDPFEPFGDRRGKDRTGLGLGLSIARKAVRSHGGDIHIHNTPGTGCAFVIDLPLARDTAPGSFAAV
jgi:signal transduction histidine kinase